MRPRALLLCVATLLAATGVPRSARTEGNPLDTASEADKAAANREFQNGMAAFNGKRYEQALASFRASYSIVVSPNSHLMIVHSLIKLGRSAEAYNEAELVVAEAEAITESDRYDQTAKAARTEMADLKTKIGLVTVKISSPPPGAVLVVAGRPIADTDWGRPIPVDPGPVDISLSSTEGEEKRQITIAAGGSQTVRLGPEEETPDATTTAPSTTSTPDTDAAFNPFDGGADQRMVSYIAGGVGAAGLLTFAIFGGLHLSQYGDLEDSCTDGVCPADLEDDADTGRTYQTVANVSLVFGLVGVAAGTALFFTSDWMTLFDGEGSSAALSIGPGSVMVTGSF